jgi:hypothetical protein
MHIYNYIYIYTYIYIYNPILQVLEVRIIYIKKVKMKKIKGFWIMMVVL